MAAWLKWLVFTQDRPHAVGSQAVLARWSHPVAWDADGGQSRKHAFLIEHCIGSIEANLFFLEVVRSLHGILFMLEFFLCRFCFLFHVLLLNLMLRKPHCFALNRRMYFLMGLSFVRFSLELEQIRMCCLGYRYVLSHLLAIFCIPKKKNGTTSQIASQLEKKTVFYDNVQIFALMNSVFKQSLVWHNQMMKSCHLM